MRPDWDQWFLALVQLIAQRSIDAETKVGCVIVDTKTKLILGTGYNGFPRDTDGLPNKKPDKYPYMVHAEANALLNCGLYSNDATIYLSIPPCENCLGLLINSSHVKIRRIIFLKERNFPHAKKILDNTKANIALIKYVGESPSTLLQRASVET
jgi:dCMP deaminase